MDDDLQDLTFDTHRRQPAAPRQALATHGLSAEDEGAVGTLAASVLTHSAQGDLRIGAGENASRESLQHFTAFGDHTVSQLRGAERCREALCQRERRVANGWGHRNGPQNIRR